jgi:hypothetical protein
MDLALNLVNVGVVTYLTRQHPFRILDLPAELKLQILEYLVVVGKVFFTPGTSELCDSLRYKQWKDYRKPSLSILRVCKQIKSEAEEVYFTKNLFVLPQSFDKLSPFHTGAADPGLPNPHRNIFQDDGCRLITNLSVAFGYFSLTRADSAWEQEPPQQAFEAQSVADRREYAHTKTTFRCAQRWAKMSRALAGMAAALRELELDFANFFCPGGCCRIVDLVDFGFVGHLAPKIVRVVGLRQGEDEVVRRQIRLAFDGVPDGEEMYSKITILCNPAGDQRAKWAKWAK